MSAAIPQQPAVDRSGRARSPRRWARRMAIALGVLLVVSVASAAPILARFVAQDGAAPVVTGVDRVALVDGRFGPPAVEVPVGTTVTFDWVDGADHDVRFDDGVSSPVQSAGTYTRTFDEPGSYPFSCTLHAFMDGRVEVVD